MFFVKADARCPAETVCLQFVPCHFIATSLDLPSKNAYRWLFALLTSTHPA